MMQHTSVREKRKHEGPYPCKLITPPSIEPLSLAEAKLHCQVDHDAEDAWFSPIIVAARGHIEQITNRQLITATWDVFPPCFPCEREMRLPFGELQSVGAFEWTNTAGSTQSWTVSSGNLLSGSTVMAHVDDVSEPSRIVLADSMHWPTDTLRSSNPIRVRITVGYGDDSADVPDPIKQAMLLLIRHWYDNRSAVEVGNSSAVESAEIKIGVEALLANYILRSF